MSIGNPYQSPTFESPSYDDIAMLEEQLGPREKFSVIDLLFSFQGRMTRLMYWMVNIFATLAYIAIVIAYISIAGTENETAGMILSILYIPFAVSMFAAQIKRWHDRNKSGWWFLVGCIPMIGPLWVFIELGCMAGTYGSNDYGEMPMI